MRISSDFYNIIIYCSRKNERLQYCLEAILDVNQSKDPLEKLNGIFYFVDFKRANRSLELHWQLELVEDTVFRIKCYFHSN